MPPRMLVVAGPPGSGKSTLLRPDEHAYFNADERARDLNHGSGRNISPEVRAAVKIGDATTDETLRKGSQSRNIFLDAGRFSRL